jgi:hypothetical protein
MSDLVYSYYSASADGGPARNEIGSKNEDAPVKTRSSSPSNARTAQTLCS